MITHFDGLDDKGNKLKSTPPLLGGLCSLVGGVEDSDKPDEPAVDGLPSKSTESLFAAAFLRTGTPSGHEHCLFFCLMLRMYEKTT